MTKAPRSRIGSEGSTCLVTAYPADRDGRSRLIPSADHQLSDLSNGEEPGRAALGGSIAELKSPRPKTIRCNLRCVEGVCRWSGTDFLLGGYPEPENNG